MIRQAWIGMFLIVCALLAGCTPAGGTRPVQHVAADPKAAELNMRLGINYLQRGDYAIALEKLEKALTQNPNLPSAHNTIAILYQRLNEMDKAEHHFEQAVNRQPDYSAAHNNYGVFLCQKKRYAEAEQHFLEAIKNPLYESPAQAYENAGLCVNRIPDQTLAETYFRKALQLAPQSSKSLIQMAKLRLLDIDYLDARSYLERYKQVAAWTPQALYTAIQIEYHLNDKNAVSSYALLLRGRFPDSDEALKVKAGEYK
jgi:type IV pilus assembly protein PilF